MEVLKENLSELDMGNTTASVQKFLDSQRELFHGQIDQLQNIVVTQCKLTGVNPLSQEMAAGALSINIGKRPRDLLNPKAVKYMQSVFSIKDAISKKESREISALFGVTVTQVREFFTSQRTRVRKVVRLSREKSIKSNACQEPQNGVSTSFDPMTAIDPLPLNTVGPTSVEEAPFPLNTVGPTSVEEAPVPLNTIGPTSVDEAPVPLNTVGPASVEEAPSCSTQEEALPGIDGPDKNFVQNIFSLMRKEETFSGQVKLMEWILQMQNSLVLNWFLTKGGVMILATWLSQAAIEEQTSVLFVILKVLCHLPLHQALPVHMSAILQSVNRLRFYRTSDISNRARVLLSRWSKIFARSQAMKKPNGIKSSADLQKEIMLKQSISEVMADESWQSKINAPEEIFAPSYENSENFRNSEPSKALKLLPASADDPSRKNIRGSRERRKVLLVEQPGQKTAGRSQQVTRAVPASQGRPMSADDIQKAKIRAQFMQSKHGKIGGSSNGIHGEKTEGSSRPLVNQANVSLLASKVHLRPQIEEHQKPVTLPSNQLGASIHPKPSLDPKEPLWEKCKRAQIPWQTPPEVIIHSQWGVGAGENSKEVEVQKNRIRREKETIYQKVQEIPHNPKNPWDIEMDYDDSLTPEIPTDQPPDADNALTEASPSPPLEYENRATVTSAAVSSQAGGGGSAPEPDLELLAVLLKNPELVFALTSGQAGSMSSEETMRLLDMIKSSGGGLLGNVNGLGGNAKAEERVEVSLPSPTPSSNPGTSGWRPEAVNNPFSKRNSMANMDVYASPAIATTTPAMEKLPPTALTRPLQIPTITSPQQPTSIPQSQQHFHASMPSYSMPQTIIPHEYQSDLHNPIMHSPTPSTRHYPGAAGPPGQVEMLNNVEPATISISLNTSDRTPVSFLLPTPTPQQAQPQPPTPQQAQPQPPFITESTHMMPPYSRQVGNPAPVSDPWRARQSLGSNPYPQVDRNNYSSSYGGPRQTAGPMQPGPGPPWERDEYVDEDEFEHWSPESRYNNRSQENMSGWNYSESRTNFGRNYRPDRGRPRNSSGYQDHGRHGNRRWSDHDRRR